MQMRNFNINSHLMIAWVVAYFFVANVSNFTRRDNHKLFVLTSKRIYDSELAFLGAYKWPEMNKKVVSN